MAQHQKAGKLIGSAALGLTLLTLVTPAEAGFRGFGGGFAGPFVFSPHGGYPAGGLAAGLIGGLAFGALAASANQARAVEVPVQTYARMPDETTVYVDPGEEWVGPRAYRPAVRPSHRPVRVAPRPPAAPSSPVALSACREAIAKASRPYGGTRVSLTHAEPNATGSVGRNPAGESLSVDARVEYRNGAQREVRSARVTCRLGQDGRVVAIR
jgi:hypothetical protein